MTRFAVNVGFLYPELPYLDRFAAARAAGFEAVESAWPTVSLASVAGAIRAAGLRVVLLNMDAGDLAAGERGFANDPGRRDWWRRAFETAVGFAGDVACPQVNVLLGNDVPGVDRAAQWACIRENLEWAAAIARAAGVRLLLEVLNDGDTPTHVLTRASVALDLVDELGDPPFGFQFDTYHLGIMEPDLVALARRLGGRIAHVQLADVPGRHEPRTGGLELAGFFEVLAEIEYRGAVGLEYRPAAGTDDGLAWLPVAARAWSDVPFVLAGPR